MNSDNPSINLVWDMSSILSDMKDQIRYETSYNELHKIVKPVRSLPPFLGMEFLITSQIQDCINATQERML